MHPGALLLLAILATPAIIAYLNHRRSLRDTEIFMVSPSRCFYRLKELYQPRENEEWVDMLKWLATDRFNELVQREADETLSDTQRLINDDRMTEIKKLFYDLVIRPDSELAHDTEARNKHIATIYHTHRS